MIGDFYDESAYSRLSSIIGKLPFCWGDYACAHWAWSILLNTSLLGFIFFTFPILVFCSIFSSFLTNFCYCLISFCSRSIWSIFLSFASLYSNNSLFCCSWIWYLFFSLWINISYSFLSAKALCLSWSILTLLCISSLYFYFIWYFYFLISISAAFLLRSSSNFSSVSNLLNSCFILSSLNLLIYSIIRSRFSALDNVVPDSWFMLLFCAKFWAVEYWFWSEKSTLWYTPRRLRIRIYGACIDFGKLWAKGSSDILSACSRVILDMFELSPIFFFRWSVFRIWARVLLMAP